ncbi:MAG: PBP1A family penicillin-binding protein [Hyphomicrobium sp.]
MSDWFFKQGDRDRVFNWLGLDSRIDSFVAETISVVQNHWNSASSFFARFRLTGWKRLGNELASEAVSMATGGFIVLYALALPALLEFDENKFLEGQYSVRFLDKSGNEIGKRGILQNDSVPLEEIPDHVIKATLGTEDRRFFEHWGVDFLGTFRALIENIKANDVVQGGSSLTQQLAKNIFLTSERSIDRKIKEVFIAFLLESRLTKRQILKLYLDRAYLGGGAFGVEAGAQFYFGKSVRDVNLAEAALLAGLYKAPTKYAPHLNLPSSRARTNEVLSNLVEAGFYTAAQVHEARLNPAKIVETQTTNSPDWFLDYAFEEVKRIAAGKGPYVLTARTTIDLPMQRSADEAMATAYKQYRRSNRINAGALVALETDGAVKALVGGPDYGENQFNRATHARRQPGSSFKVYVYATALENGYRPETSVSDSSPSCGNWHPQNYGGSHGGGGRMPLWLALAKSLNTVAVQLSLKVGREKVIDMTKRVGISNIRKTCSMALGDYGITPLEHTGGLATFANGGKRAKPYAILELFNSKGELIYSRERDEPEAPQVVSKIVAQQMNQMLQKVVTDGTGTRAALDFTHSAGKTGTSTGPRDIWFVGFTGKYVASVWFGNDDNSAMSGGNTGGQLAAPVWHSFMSVAHKDYNIPTIPGLPPHPVQLAEQQRVAALKESDPVAAAEQSAAETAQKSSSLMPDQTREALRKLTGALRKAAGLPELAPSPTTPAPASGPGGQPPAKPAAKDNRAAIDDDGRGRAVSLP